MKTVINIGLTHQKNITGVEFNKPFDEITHKDVLEVVKKHYPTEKVQIQGWSHINPKPGQYLDY